MYCIQFFLKYEQCVACISTYKRASIASHKLQALIILAARGRSRLPSVPITRPNLEPCQLRILKRLFGGAFNEKAREFYETGAVNQRPWARFNGDGSLDPLFISIPAMKNKGFTLVELVVACTLLLMLSTIATTSTYNFVQATANLKAQYNNIQNIMALHSALVQAKMNYATDLALEASIRTLQRSQR